MLEKQAENYARMDNETYLRFLRAREKTLLPLVKFLTHLGLKADYITLIGFLLLVGLMIYAISNPQLAAVFLLLHVLLDGLDGVMARHQGTAGTAGEFVDTVADYSGMAVIMIILSGYHLLDPWWALIYVFLYIVMAVFVIARYLLGIPAKFIARNKYIIYATYIFWAFTNINFIEIAVIVFCILMAVVDLGSFNTLRRRLKEHNIKLKNY